VRRVPASKHPSVVRAILVACLLVAPLPGAWSADGDRAAEFPVRRGPAEIRDEQLLAQPRLTLPAVSPQTLPPGRWQLRVGGLWSNTFAWTQDVPGETPADRRFLIDGEAATVDLTVRRGLTHRLDVGVRVPVRWRGGGVLDGLIDGWHRLVGAPSGNRPDFLRDVFRVEGRSVTGSPFEWDTTGSALGGIELDARWRVVDGGADDASTALISRLFLPTGTGPFAGHGWGAGVQAVVDVPVGRRVDLYAGPGVTVQDPGPVDGVEYARARGEGFLAVEWRPWRRASLVAQTNAATRLVDSIDRYPGTHWVVTLSASIDLGRRSRLEVGFTENLISQLTTADIAFHAAFSLRP
jgi:hypothetical protein